MPITAPGIASRLTRSGGYVGCRVLVGRRSKLQQPGASPLGSLLQCGAGALHEVVLFGPTFSDARLDATRAISCIAHRIGYNRAWCEP